MAHAGTIRTVLVADTSRFITGMRTSAQSVMTFGKETAVAGYTLIRFGSLLSAGIIVPLTFAVKSSIKQFSDFDKKMTETEALAGGMSAKMRNNMEDMAKKVATSVSSSATELAGAYLEMTQGGIPVIQQMANLATIASYAKVAMVDEQKATKDLLGIQSAFGANQGTVAQNSANLLYITNLLTEANVRSLVSVDDLAMALTNRGATAARMFGQSIRDTTAWMAVAANQGLRGATAGEQYSIMLRQMTVAQQRNAEAWQTLGVSMYDAFGRSRPLLDVMTDLHARLVGLSTEAKAFVLFKQLGIQARSIVPIMMTMQHLPELADQIAALGDVSGAVSKRFAILGKSFAFQWGQVRAELQNAAIELGKTIAPHLEAFRKRIGVLVEWFRSLSDSVKWSMVKWSAFAAGVGLLTTALGVLVFSLGSVFTLLGWGAKTFGHALSSLTAVRVATDAESVALAALDAVIAQNALLIKANVGARTASTIAHTSSAAATAAQTMATASASVAANVETVALYGVVRATEAATTASFVFTEQLKRQLAWEFAAQKTTIKGFLPSRAWTYGKGIPEAKLPKSAPQPALQLEGPSEFAKVTEANWRFATEAAAESAAKSKGVWLKASGNIGETFTSRMALAFSTIQFHFVNVVNALANILKRVLFGWPGLFALVFAGIGAIIHKRLGKPWKDILKGMAEDWIKLIPVLAYDFGVLVMDMTNRMIKFVRWLGPFLVDSWKTIVTTMHDVWKGFSNFIKDVFSGRALGESLFFAANKNIDEAGKMYMKKVRDIYESLGGGFFTPLTGEALAEAKKQVEALGPAPTSVESWHAQWKEEQKQPSFGDVIAGTRSFDEWVQSLKYKKPFENTINDLLKSFTPKEGVVEQGIEDAVGGALKDFRDDLEGLGDDLEGLGDDLGLGGGALKGRLAEHPALAFGTAEAFAATQTELYDPMTDLVSTTKGMAKDVNSILKEITSPTQEVTEPAWTPTPPGPNYAEQTGLLPSTVEGRRNLFESLLPPENLTAPATTAMPEIPSPTSALTPFAPTIEPAKASLDNYLDNLVSMKDILGGEQTLSNLAPERSMSDIVDEIASLQTQRKNEPQKVTYTDLTGNKAISMKRPETVALPEFTLPEQPTAPATVTKPQAPQLIAAPTVPTPEAITPPVSVPLAASTMQELPSTLDQQITSLTDEIAASQIQRRQEPIKSTFLGPDNYKAISMKGLEPLPEFDVARDFLETGLEQRRAMNRPVTGPLRIPALTQWQQGVAAETITQPEISVPEMPENVAMTEGQSPQIETSLPELDVSRDIREGYLREARKRNKRMEAFAPVTAEGLAQAPPVQGSADWYAQQAPMRGTADWYKQQQGIPITTGLDFSGAGLSFGAGEQGLADFGPGGQGPVNWWGENLQFGGGVNWGAGTMFGEGGPNANMQPLPRGATKTAGAETIPGAGKEESDKEELDQMIQLLTEIRDQQRKSGSFSFKDSEKGYSFAP